MTWEECVPGSSTVWVTMAVWGWLAIGEVRPRKYPVVAIPTNTEAMSAARVWRTRDGGSGADRWGGGWDGGCDVEGMRGLGVNRWS
jgi:hypothetical protein